MYFHFFVRWPNLSGTAFYIKFQKQYLYESVMSKFETTNWELANQKLAKRKLANQE